jgi:hypothetical protein
MTDSPYHTPTTHSYYKRRNRITSRSSLNHIINIEDSENKSSLVYELKQKMRDIEEDNKDLETSVKILQKEIQHAEKIKKDIEDACKCRICYHTMYRPTTLPCGHTACSYCITMNEQHMMRNTQMEFKCFLCRSAYPYFSGRLPLNVSTKETIIALYGEKEYMNLGLTQMHSHMTDIFIGRGTGDEANAWTSCTPYSPNIDYGWPHGACQFLMIFSILCRICCPMSTRKWKTLISCLKSTLSHCAVFIAQDHFFYNERQLVIQIDDTNEREYARYLVASYSTGYIIPDVSDAELLSFWNKVYDADFRKLE